MNFKDAFPGLYLKADDIEGVEPIVTISHIETEPIGPTKEMRLVAHFQGKHKGLVLNLTNSNMIAQLTDSNDTDDWVGARIKLFATTTEYQGKTVPCIRVKSATPKPSKAKVKPTPVEVDDANDALADVAEEDEIPFAWMMPFVLPALLFGASVLC